MQQETSALPLVFTCGGGQIQGSRDEQEDYFLLVPADKPASADYALAILADGMGAHSDGAEASREIVCAYYTALTKPEVEYMCPALEEANATLSSVKQSGFIQQDAGATFIGLLLKGGTCSWVSVGDSLLYLFRDGALTPLNNKHVWARQLELKVQQGLMTREEADAFPDKNALYSAVCGEAIAEVDFRPHAFRYQEGDRFLIASDGLATILPELEELLRRPEVASMPPGELCNMLLSRVESAHSPNQDNTTLMVVDVAAARPAAAPAPQPAPAPATAPSQTASAMGLGLVAHSRSLLGDRDNQQDNAGLWSSPKHLLAVVADGAGGHVGGAQASATAVAVLKELWESRLNRGCSVEEAAQLISSAMLEAHERIIELGGGNAAHSGKCAIVATYVSGGQYAVIHAGDCRLYQGTQEGWQLRTEDDSVLQMLINAGRITPEEAAGHPDQGRLTQALGSSTAPQPHISSGELTAGDSLLLCCDGFWNQLPATLWNTGNWDVSAQQRGQQLTSLAEEAVRAAQGDSDNVTAIWISPSTTALAWKTASKAGILLYLLLALILMALTAAGLSYMTLSGKPADAVPATPAPAASPEAKPAPAPPAEPESSPEPVPAPEANEPSMPEPAPAPEEPKEETPSGEAPADDDVAEEVTPEAQPPSAPQPTDGEERGSDASPHPRDGGANERPNEPSHPAATPGEAPRRLGPFQRPGRRPHPGEKAGNSPGNGSGSPSHNSPEKEGEASGQTMPGGGSGTAPQS